MDPITGLAANIIAVIQITQSSTQESIGHNLTDVLILKYSGKALYNYARASEGTRYGCADLVCQFLNNEACL